MASTIIGPGEVFVAIFPETVITPIGGIDRGAGRPILRRVGLSIARGRVCFRFRGMIAFMGRLRNANSDGGYRSVIGIELG